MSVYVNYVRPSPARGDAAPSRDLSAMTVRELLPIAEAMGIEVTSKARKADIIAAIEGRRG